MGHADLDTALASLVTHLELADEGSMWAVIVSTLGAQERVADDLAQRLSDRRVERFRFRGDALSLATRLRAMPDGSEGVLLALDLDSLPREQRRRAIALLNRGREALAEGRWHVVLFLSPETEREVISAAGDFWSWRRGVTDCTKLFEGVDFEQERGRLRGRYLETLLDRTREYPLPRLVQRRSKSSSRRPLPEFDAAYLPPRALRAAASHGDSPTWVPLDEALAVNDRLLIVAARGEGRSRLLQYALREESKRALEGVSRARVPIALSCPTVQRLVGARARGDLVDIIAPLFQHESLGAFTSVALDALERGEALLVVDDFDDLPSAEDRAHAARWIEQTLRAHPGVRMLAVISPDTWQGTVFDGDYARLGLPSLSIADVGVLIERLTGQRAERLLFDVRDDPSLRAELAKPFNALLYGLQAQEGRTRFMPFFVVFEHIVETLKESPFEADVNVVLGCLQFATVYRGLRGETVLRTGDVEVALHAGAGLPAESARAVASWLIDESGLLVHVDDDRARWARTELLVGVIAAALSPSSLTSTGALAAVVEQRHRRLWSDALGSAFRSGSPSTYLTAGAWVNALKNALPSAHEDLLHRDALLLGAFLSAKTPGADELLDALRDQLFALLESEWSRRLPDLAREIVLRLATRGVSQSLESSSSGAGEERSLALSQHPDDAVALDGILLRLSSTRSSILSPVDLSRIAVAFGSPRRVVRVRAWRCVELLAVDLDALSELASYAYGDPVARDVITRATALSLTQRSSQTRGDNAWELGLSLCRSLIGDPSPAIRAAAAEGLACDTSTPPVEPLVFDADPDVRAASLSAWRAAIPPAWPLGMTGDPSASVRAAVAGVLSRDASPEALAALLTLARDADGRVRLASVTSLRVFDDPRARAALFDALIDRDEAVRDSAVGALRSALRDVDELDAAISAHASSRAWSTVDAGLAGARLGLRHDWVKNGLQDGMMRGLAEQHSDLLRAVIDAIPLAVDDVLGDAVVRPLLMHADASVRAASWDMVRGRAEVPTCCRALVTAHLAEDSALVRMAAARACEVALGDSAATRAAWATLLDDRAEEVVACAASLLRDAGTAGRWDVTQRKAICDDLAARLRDGAYRAAASDETLGALWAALRDVVAALTEERVL